MARLLKDTCETARAIIAGELDSDLDFIVQAAQARKKAMFRKGTKCRLVGTRNAHLEGNECEILKVNSKTITVGVGINTPDVYGDDWSGGTFNVSPALLEVLS